MEVSFFYASGIQTVICQQESVTENENLVVCCRLNIPLSFKKVCQTVLLLLREDTCVDGNIIVFVKNKSVGFLKKVSANSSSSCNIPDFEVNNAVFVCNGNSYNAIVEYSQMNAS